ncbi:MAG: hypothetical protein ACYSWR_02575 [Planctomycetota bacterium]
MSTTVIVLLGPLTVGHITEYEFRRVNSHVVNLLSPPGIDYMDQAVGGLDCPWVGPVCFLAADCQQCCRDRYPGFPICTIE